MPSRVDFYVLAEDAPEARLRCACRLVEKAVERDHRVYVRTASTQEARHVDELLWTFNDRTFLPHAMWEDEAPVHPLIKVLIGDRPPPESHRELLVNLNPQPPDIEAHARIIEIVDGDQERKRLAREHYKYYRERGCALETHNL